MTLLHQIVFQILDRGGATDETITALNKLGLCVSPLAPAKEKQELQKRQMKHIDRLMLEEKEVEK